jgi:hypothetical protein
MSTDDETQPASGSRWEQPDDTAPQPAAPPPAPTPAYSPAPPANRNRGRLLLAGGAVGVALVAGSGGFALGHATAGDGNDGAGMRRPSFGTNGGPGGFPGNGQQQQQPPGFQDGQDGTFPDDRDGDDDGSFDDDDQDPSDGSTQGSSNT